MRFKEGGRVEVLVGLDNVRAWWCCEIISGNGSSYNVKCKYGLRRCDADNTKWVSWENIRPCPSAIDGSDSWVVGDMVELFDEFLWKQAIILKAMTGGYYFSRILGSTKEVLVHKVHIRTCQIWQDGKWFVDPNVHGSHCKGHMKPIEKSCSSHLWKMNSSAQQTYTKVQTAVNCPATEINNAILHESCVVSARTLKRASPLWPTEAEVYGGKSRKLRAVTKNNEQLPVIEKVYIVAHPEEHLGRTYMHSRSTSRTHLKSLQHDNSDSDACSVGSCSGIDHNADELAYRIVAGTRPDKDVLSSAAESFCGRDEDRDYCQVVVGEDVEGIIHSLELHAYRCTLEALYDSGGLLSWEKVELLTNLRASLNISNDEHLTELRNLISQGTSSHVS